MANLSRLRFRFSLSSLLAVVAVSACVTFLVKQFVIDSPGGFVVIDCSVPNTEVFYRDKNLGRVPVQISGRELATVLETKKIPVEQIKWRFEDYGHYFYFDAGAKRHRFHIKTPEATVSEYETHFTQWGRRTRVAGMAVVTSYPTGVVLYPDAVGDDPVEVNHIREW